MRATGTAGGGTPRARSRLRSWMRDGSVILLLSAALLVVLEAVVRIVAPQSSTMEFVRGESLGLGDDTLGHVNRPDAIARQRTPEFEVEYEVNAQGFRDEDPVPEASSRTRVLLLGDSFAFGAGVEYEATFGAVAVRMLQDAGLPMDIVKAGVSGYDTRQEVLYLERLLPSLDPDVVVFAFLPNDLFTNRPLGEPVPSHLEDVTVQLRSQKQSQLHAVTLLKRLLMRSDPTYLRLYLRTSRAAYYRDPPGELLATQLGITAELLAAASERCRRNGSRLVVLSIPQLFQVIVSSRAGGLPGVDAGYIDRTLSAAAADLGVAWVPVLPALVEEYRGARTELYHRFDGHLTEAGNRVVARELATFLSGASRDRAARELGRSSR